MNKKKHASKFGIKGNRSNRDKKLLNKNLENSIDTQTVDYRALKYQTHQQALEIQEKFSPV